MNRLERLYAIIEYLRSRNERPVAVPDIATRFGVAERTLFRDLATLRDQNVPIYGEPGRAGGIWLGGEYSMPPVGLSIGEAIGLWLAYRLGSSASSGIPGESLSTAMGKILATLPVERRRRYTSVLDRIIVGIAPSHAVLMNSTPVLPEVYRECELAIVESRRLRIRYTDRAGTETEREVDPHGVLIQAPLWYLLVYDHLRQAPRMFRIDRIRQADVDPVLRFTPSDPRQFFKEIEEQSLELPS